MNSFKHTVSNPNGFHSRAIGSLVKEARKYSGNSTINFNGKSADLRKIFAIMSLGMIKQGDVVTFTTNCKNAAENAALQQFVCANI